MFLLSDIGQDFVCVLSDNGLGHFVYIYFIVHEFGILISKHMYTLTFNFQNTCTLLNINSFLLYFSSEYTITDLC